MWETLMTDGALHNQTQAQCSIYVKNIYVTNNYCGFKCKEYYWTELIMNNDTNVF